MHLTVSTTFEVTILIKVMQAGVSPLAWLVDMVREKPTRRVQVDMDRTDLPGWSLEASLVKTSHTLTHLRVYLVLNLSR